MPRVSYAVLSTSSDEAGSPSLCGQLRGGEWTVLNLQSMETIPFSEVSHVSYEKESTYLNSVTQAGLVSVVDVAGTNKVCTDEPISIATPQHVSDSAVHSTSEDGESVAEDANGTTPQPESTWRPLHLAVPTYVPTREVSMTQPEMTAVTTASATTRPAEPDTVPPRDGASSSNDNNNGTGIGEGGTIEGRGGVVMTLPQVMPAMGAANRLLLTVQEGDRRGATVMTLPPLRNGNGGATREATTQQQQQLSVQVNGRDMPQCLNDSTDALHTAAALSDNASGASHAPTAVTPSAIHTAVSNKTQPCVEPPLPSLSISQRAQGNDDFAQAAGATEGIAVTKVSRTRRGSSRRRVSTTRSPAFAAVSIDVVQPAASKASLVHKAISAPLLTSASCALQRTSRPLPAPPSSSSSPQQQQPRAPTNSPVATLPSNQADSSAPSRPPGHTEGVARNSRTVVSPHSQGAGHVSDTGAHVAPLHAPSTTHAPLAATAAVASSQRRARDNASPQPPPLPAGPGAPRLQPPPPLLPASLRQFPHVSAGVDEGGATVEGVTSTMRRARNTSPSLTRTGPQPRQMGGSLHGSDVDTPHCGRVATATPGRRPDMDLLTEDRLVKFVRAVSDAEVLHVIHDYLVEKKHGPRYAAAARVCTELLTQRERLLSLPAAPHRPVGAVTVGDGDDYGAGLPPRPRAPTALVSSPAVSERERTNSASAASQKGGGGDGNPAAGDTTTLPLADQHQKEQQQPSGAPLGPPLPLDIDAAPLLVKAAEDDAEEQLSMSVTSIEDEFDEMDLLPTPYPYRRGFNFAEPSVSGTVTRVFREGMLYRIKDVNGNYYFFNDTLREIMMVRIRRVLNGEERINHTALQVRPGEPPARSTTVTVDTAPLTLTPQLDSATTAAAASVASGRESEITIAVLPEATTFLIGGVGSLPRVMAKAVQVPDGFVAPSVRRCAERVNAGIDAVRALLGPWERATDQYTFLKACLRHHVKFTDLSFRPNAHSLFRADCDLVKILPLTWRRPEEYLCLTEVSGARLFRGEISCHLVRQGELSDHTVVAAIAAVAQYPQHVLWLFRHPSSALLGKRERAVGCYRVHLLRNGWWQNVVLDDYVPASLRGPLFARCPDDPRRLWVTLLEKAYAKMVGSYAALCTEDVMDVLCNLTGYPARSLNAQWTAAATTPHRHSSPSPSSSPSSSTPTAAAARTPSEDEGTLYSAAAISLFDSLACDVRRGCTVLLFTPAASDRRASETIDLSRKRSSRFLPVNGVVPQFLPGHVYVLCDTAYYGELDLRMVRLKNPWTWETQRHPNKEVEKRWKYTAWYARPEMSLSASSVGMSISAVPAAPARRLRAETNSAVKGANARQLVTDDKRGTMWLEWNEALKVFCGGGVCYTLWDWYSYRVQGSFAATTPHAPRVILELRTTVDVEAFVSVLLEDIDDVVDLDGNVTGTRRRNERRGVGLAISQRATQMGRAEQHVQLRATADLEQPAVIDSGPTSHGLSSSPDYVRAREVTLKAHFAASAVPYYILPTLEPGPAGGAPRGATEKCGDVDEQAAVTVPYVFSLLLSQPVHTGQLEVHFRRMDRDCGFLQGANSFTLSHGDPVRTVYQRCAHRGVRTMEGTALEHITSDGVTNP